MCAFLLMLDLMASVRGKHWRTIFSNLLSSHGESAIVLSEKGCDGVNRSAEAHEREKFSKKDRESTRSAGKTTAT